MNPFIFRILGYLGYVFSGSWQPEFSFLIGGSKLANEESPECFWLNKVCRDRLLIAKKDTTHPNIAHPFGNAPEMPTIKGMPFFGLFGKRLRLGLCSSPVCWFTTLDYRLDSTTKDKIGKKRRTNCLEDHPS